MNIEASNVNIKNDTTAVNSSSNQKNDSSVNFADELKELKASDKQEKETKLSNSNEDGTEDAVQKETLKSTDQQENDDISSQNALTELNSVINKLNQSEEKRNDLFKNKFENDDRKNRNDGAELINNDFNIQENKEILPQMNPNMNFGSDGQPFSSFMNNEERTKNAELTLNAKDLEEEAAIMSTMAENVAMANKINVVEKPEQKIVNKNNEIKKVNTKTGITEEVIVKYDTVIMNEADVEVFTNLVENGEVNLNNLAPESAQKSVHVSKTLADMLAKAMEDNKPVRIEFDNGISVIIKISRDGKLSADFLPSTQVAEAYLKENLPLLKQRFDEQNIDYDELNRRERREQDKEQQKQKGRENE